MDLFLRPYLERMTSAGTVNTFLLALLQHQKSGLMEDLLKLTGILANVLRGFVRLRPAFLILLVNNFAETIRDTYWFMRCM